jgi:myo-inositol-1(or 4)-monophosphatase
MAARKAADAFLSGGGLLSARPPRPQCMMRPMFMPSNELVTMMAAARAAGAGLMGRFRGRADLKVLVKGPADFASAADLESEETLRSILLGSYPAFGMLAEESEPTVAVDARRARFVVDPLDGTTNFLHGIPHFAVAIALEREGQVVAGVVFDPPKNELFFAEQGRGAWVVSAASALHDGADRLAVSTDTDFSRALIATGIPHANSVDRHGAYLKMLGASMREAAGIRRLAAAALDLAYVASGRFGAFFEFGLARWDLAAAGLLVTEAGGRLSEPSGGPAYLDGGDVLATNGHLHERMLAILRGA